MGRHHDHRCAGIGSLDLTEGSDAVSVGKDDIEQDQLGFVLYRPQARGQAGMGRDPVPEGLKGLSHYPGYRFIVIDDEDLLFHTPTRAERRSSDRRTTRSALPQARTAIPLSAKRNRDMKRRPRAGGRRAFDPDKTVVVLHDLLRERQAETGAFLLPRVEGKEYLLEITLRDSPPGVADGYHRPPFHQASMHDVFVGGLCRYRQLPPPGPRLE